MTRQEANLKIVEKLKEFFEENPDIRFFQGLQGLGLQQCKQFNLGLLIDDNFYEESTETLNKLK